MAHLYEQVLSIVTKPPEQRQDKEIQRIVYWFRKKSELFKNLKEEIILDILKNCRFASFNKDDLIIQQGEKGECFYIILSGSVAIYINTNLTEEDLEDEERLKKHESQSHTSVIERSKYGNYVGKIVAGKSFGELALIRKDSVRNATIIANEQTDLLVVNRDLYNRSLLTYQAHEYETKKDFVDHYRLFQHWQPRYKKMMAMSLVKTNIKFEDVVIKQTQPVEGLYFIISGQVKVIIDASQHSVQYPDLFPKTKVADLEKEKARDLLRKEMNLESLKTYDKKAMYQKMKGPYEAKKDSRYIELCLLGAVEIIGDLEMVLGLPTYAETVICTEEAEIYFLDLKNYDRLIEKRNPQAIDQMRNILHTKLTLHFQRLSEDKLPLFRFFLYTLDEKERTNKMRDTHQSQHVSSKQEECKSIDCLKKGPLVNLFGPGSVFYIIRMREKERRRRTLRERFTAKKSPVSVTTSSVARLLKGKRNIIDDMMKGILPNIDFSAALGEISQSQKDLSQKSRKNLLDNVYISRLVAEEEPDVLEQPKEEPKVDVGGDVPLAVDDEALCELERRIQEWYTSIGDTVSRVERSANKPVKLHRFQIEDDTQKPRPGNKVYIHGKYRPKSVNLESIRKHESVQAVKSSRSHCLTTRTTMSSAQSFTISDEDEDEAVKSRRSPVLSRSAKQSSSRSSPFMFQVRKTSGKRQYTVEEYMALKEELKRRQRAYKSFLPLKSSTVF